MFETNAAGNAAGGSADGGSGTGRATTRTEDRLDCTVAVYGCDRSGLAVATASAGVGADVLVAATDSSYVQSVADGEVPGDATKTFRATLRSARASRRLSPTTKVVDAARGADVHVLSPRVTVRPDGHVDLSSVRQLVRTIGPTLDEGELVVVDGPVPPGTTRTTVGPIVRETSDADPGTVTVAYCARPRRPLQPLRALRRGDEVVVGTVDGTDPTLPAAFFERTTSKHPEVVDAATTAELFDLRRALRRSLLDGLDAELSRVAEALDADVGTVIDTDRRLGTDGRIDAWKSVDPSLAAMVERETPDETPLLSGLRQTTSLAVDAVANTVLRGLHAADLEPGDSSVLFLGVPDERRGQVVLERIAASIGSTGAAVHAVDETVDHDAHDVSSVSVDTLDRLDPAAAVLAVRREHLHHRLRTSVVSPPVFVDACGEFERPIAPFSYRIGRGRLD